MTELLIEHPPGYESERTYIYDVMFGEFLGISYRMKVGAEPKRVVITARATPVKNDLLLMIRCSEHNPMNGLHPIHYHANLWRCGRCQIPSMTHLRSRPRFRLYTGNV